MRTLTPSLVAGGIVRVGVDGQRGLLGVAMDHQRHGARRFGFRRQACTVQAEGSWPSLSQFGVGTPWVERTGSG
jgi:hypothetical protein